MKRFAVLFLFALPSFAQECSNLWVKELAINPTGPKGFVGDTYAAYGLMGYKNVKNLGWRVVGKFPHSRFMSIETYIYKDKKKLQYDVQYDYQMKAVEGSENPFVEGNLMEAPSRDFTVDLIPKEGKSAIPNVIHISPKEKVIAAYFRVYAPNDGVTITAADLPKVYAYDVTTGKEMKCPTHVPVLFAPNWPQWLTASIPVKNAYSFESVKTTFFASQANNGNNAAIKDYFVGMSRVTGDQVIVVKFKSPTFVDTTSGAGPFPAAQEVRYWSLCTQNIVKGHTLNCLPDYLAKASTNGWITVAVGKGNAVKKAAEERGYNFIEDKRKSDQPVMQFIYRNMMPREDFDKNNMYKGDYVPRAVMCTEKKFLDGGC